MTTLYNRRLRWLEHVSKLDDRDTFIHTVHYLANLLRAGGYKTERIRNNWWKTMQHEELHEWGCSLIWGKTEAKDTQKMQEQNRLELATQTLFAAVIM